LERLRHATEWVEKEAGWVQHLAQNEQMLKLLRRGYVTDMSMELPYRKLPRNRNTQFHFRANALQDLRDFLQPGDLPSSLRSASIHGLGGIGKTQLALEFAYRHTALYDAIFWIKADNKSKIRESILNYAQEVSGDRDTGPQDDAALVRTFHKCLMTARTNGAMTLSCTFNRSF
jgi:hypothetical protein